MEAVAQEEGRTTGITAGCAAAAFMLVSACKLGALIRETEGSRAMLASAAELLREAVRDAERFSAYAFELVPPLTDWTVAAAAKLLAASAFEGPLPASVDAAREIVGHLSAALPPTAYLPVVESQRRLARLTASCFNAGYLFVICSVLLGLPPHGAHWQTWRDLHVYGAAQAREADTRLAAADHHAVEVTRQIFGQEWEHQDEYTRAECLSLAGEHLHDAMNQMDEALLLMRYIFVAWMTQLYVTWRTLHLHQHQA